MGSELHHDTTVSSAVSPTLGLAAFDAVVHYVVSHPYVGICDSLSATMPSDINLDVKSIKCLFQLEG